MGWSSGTFVRSYSFATDRDAGTKILASHVDGEFDNFKTGLQNCITRDNETPPTADISFGGFKLTSLADPVSAQDAVTLTKLRAGVGSVANMYGASNNFVTATNYQLGINTNHTPVIAFDTLSEMSITTGRFTAAVTGIYEATITGYFTGAPTLTSNPYFFILANGSAITQAIRGYGAVAAGSAGAFATTRAYAMARLSATEYFTFFALASFSAGSIAANYAISVKRVGT